MLDVEASLKGGFFEFSLYQKTSSIWSPLSPSSFHPEFIHIHWPRAQCQRIKKRFSDPNKGESAVMQFKALYKRLFNTSVSEKQKSSLAHKTVSWLTLPFHRSLVRGKVRSVVSSLRIPSSFSSVPDGRVRVSWRLNSQHLVHRLRRVFEKDWEAFWGWWWVLCFC